MIYLASSKSSSNFFSVFGVYLKLIIADCTCLVSYTKDFHQKNRLIGMELIPFQ
jgi:Na+-translocating ferredoxin:NAD+ oxidoreductase RnfA subunit